MWPLGHHNPIQTIRMAQQNVRSVAFSRMPPLIFHGLRRSVRGADGDVVLHFTRGLGADAQSRVSWFFTWFWEPSVAWTHRCLTAAHVAILQPLKGPARRIPSML
jgi:hypothetical protein